MITRVRTALIALCVLAPFLIFSGTFMLQIFVIVMSTVALYETFACIKVEKNYYVSVPAYLLAVIVPIFARGITNTNLFIKLLFCTFFIYGFYLMTTAVFMKNKTALHDIGFVYLMTLYIIFSFSCIIFLRDVKYGEYIFLLVFMSAWMTDMGAYAVGSVLGKHKLLEEVSPKKTIEGAIGGIIFCVLSFCLYGFIIGIIFEATPRYIPLIIVGAVMSVISQCGDLIASLIKRNYDLKDYGNIFPGHGGVMDRFDSIIAVAPFLYMLYIASPYFELFF